MKKLLLLIMAVFTLSACSNPSITDRLAKDLSLEQVIILDTDSCYDPFKGELSEVKIEDRNFYFENEVGKKAYQDIMQKNYGKYNNVKYKLLGINKGDTINMEYIPY